MLSMLANIAVFGLALLTIGIFVMLTTHLWVSVPYLPTPRKVVERMVVLAKLKPGDCVYDLGAGDGRLLVAAKRHAPEARAIGYELAPMVWLLGKFRIARSGQAVDLRFGDARKADLRDADCIFLYLLPDLMKELQAKFAQELRPGTRVVSYVFRFPDRTPEKTEKVPWLGGERTVLVYRW
jgi:precorrin-6B methylase 2